MYTGLLLAVLQNVSLAQQNVIVTTTTSTYVACYGITSVSGMAYRRINGQDVPAANLNIRISVGNSVIGQATTTSSGFYSARIEIGTKLTGDRDYTFNASVVSTGYSGGAAGRIRVNKAVTNFGYVYGGRPVAGQTLRVDVTLYTPTEAPKAGHWVSSNIGSGYTDSAGKLVFFFKPKKGANILKLDYSGNSYLKSRSSSYTIVGF